MELTDSIKKIKGVGDKTAACFGKLGISTVGDLLRHYPRSYDVYSLPIPIRDITESSVVSVEGTVAGRTEIKNLRSIKIVSCIFQDPSGKIRLKWFNQLYLKNVLRPGTKMIMRGRVVRYGGELAIEQPRIYTRDEYRRLIAVLQPVYPLTEGITNNTVSKAAGKALEAAADVRDYLPAAVRREYGLISWRDAVREIHFPKCDETMREARRRLVFDEFLIFSINIRRMKQSREVLKNSFEMRDTGACAKLESMLKYTLTGAQKKAVLEILNDLRSDVSMNRLVQGDVGSGKTIIAVMAMLFTAENGYQSCMMAPTEVLAGQHYEELRHLLEPFGKKVVMLTGSTKASQRREALESIADGSADIIIGTHALIQQKVTYKNLALVITDEQHRFGVRQRETAAKKGSNPHVLVMSATPIPRSLAIILYGDLDVSIVDELPAERLPIKNCVVGTSYRPTAYKFIEERVKEGRQAYVICPMIEENEENPAENVMEYTEKLREVLPDSCCVECLHGRMKPDKKAEIMEGFASGRIDVLVSTTVVEVGVNVPNAVVMMIENAERFGLAQLHQLRGRVGRGAYQSYCIFMSGNTSSETMQRLNILRDSNDGFRIAEEDLKLRGPGDMFGIRQSGELDFKLADIYGDSALLKQACGLAGRLTEDELAAFEENIQFQTLQAETNVIL